MQAPAATPAPTPAPAHAARVVVHASQAFPWRWTRRRPAAADCFRGSIEAAAPAAQHHAGATRRLGTMRGTMRGNPDHARNAEQPGAPTPSPHAQPPRTTRAWTPLACGAGLALPLHLVLCLGEELDRCAVHVGRVSTSLAVDCDTLGQVVRRSWVGLVGRASARLGLLLAGAMRHHGVARHRTTDVKGAAHAHVHTP